MSKFLPSFRSVTSKVAGFTMIELLIVITILGILATAVLSAINPLEQINRGRDTAAQGDAEQMLSALERFNAFQERFPWEIAGTPAAVGDGAGTGIRFGEGTPWDGVPAGAAGVLADCSVVEILGVGDTGTPGCTGTDELKSAYVTKILNLAGERQMAVYKESTSSSDNVYVCFLPQSSAFRQEAVARCGDTLPEDYPEATACPVDGSGNVDPDGVMTCLP